MNNHKITECVWREVSCEYCRGTFIVKNKQVCQKKKSILCKAFRGATSKQGKVVTTFNPYKVEILLSFGYLLLFDIKLLHGKCYKGWAKTLGSKTLIS